MPLPIVGLEKKAHNSLTLVSREKMHASKKQITQTVSRSICDRVTPGLRN
jgi:hypothetical protein